MAGGAGGQVDPEFINIVFAIVLSTVASFLNACAESLLKFTYMYRALRKDDNVMFYTFWVGIVFCLALNGVANYSALYLASLAIVAPMAAATIVFNDLLAIYFFDEGKQLHGQVWVGTGLIVVGTLLAVFGQIPAENVSQKEILETVDEVSTKFDSNFLAIAIAVALFIVVLGVLQRVMQMERFEKHPVLSNLTLQTVAYALPPALQEGVTMMLVQTVFTYTKVEAQPLPDHVVTQMIIMAISVVPSLLGQLYFVTQLTRYLPLSIGITSYSFLYMVTAPAISVTWWRTWSSVNFSLFFPGLVLSSFGIFLLGQADKPMTGQCVAVLTCRCCLRFDDGLDMDDDDEGDFYTKPRSHSGAVGGGGGIGAALEEGGQVRPRGDGSLEIGEMGEDELEGAVVHRRLSWLSVTEATLRRQQERNKRRGLRDITKQMAEHLSAGVSTVTGAMSDVGTLIAGTIGELVPPQLARVVSRGPASPNAAAGPGDPDRGSSSGTPRSGGATPRSKKPKSGSATPRRSQSVSKADDAAGRRDSPKGAPDVEMMSLDELPQSTRPASMSRAEYQASKLANKRARRATAAMPSALSASPVLEGDEESASPTNASAAAAALAADADGSVSISAGTGANSQSSTAVVRRKNKSRSHTDTPTLADLGAMLGDATLDVDDDATTPKDEKAIAAATGAAGDDAKRDPEEQDPVALREAARLSIVLDRVFAPGAGHAADEAQNDEDDSDDATFMAAGASPANAAAVSPSPEAAAEAPAAAETDSPAAAPAPAAEAAVPEASNVEKVEDFGTSAADEASASLVASAAAAADTAAAAVVEESPPPPAATTAEVAE